MERKTWTVDEFIEGSNTLPQGYHWNTVSRIDGLACIVASLSPDFGTRSEERRSLTNPTITIPLSWPDAIRLAVQITEMAQAGGASVPEGVFVKGKTH
jgi:hypothetical protein